MTTLRLVHDRSGPLEDDEIKLLARGNPRAAFDAVVRKYRDRILHHALYIVKDYQEAFDVTQEVFIKAMREKRFFDADFRMKAWLFRVTSNLCFNIVRDRKRRRAILETVPQATSFHADQDTLVFSDERQALMMQAMDELTQDHKEILLLRYYSDLSYAEIADALDIKLGTVMSRLSRAKTRLMELLSSGGVEGASELTEKLA